MTDVSFKDGLQSMVAELGTARDKATSVKYVTIEYSDQELVLAYRNSWLARKIVDIPALDTFRAWRGWQAGEDQIEAIEETEKRLGVQAKVMRAFKLARLFGSCYLYFDLGDDPTKPVAPERIKRDGLRFLTVLTHRQLMPGQVEDDPISDQFGKPMWYTVVGSKSANLRLHPTRIIAFHGAERPEEDYYFGGITGRQGESILPPVMQAIQQFDATAANIASLVFEAKIDVISVKGLTTHIAGNPAEERKMLERYRLAATAKSNNGMLILDGDGEEYSQKTYAFNALPDIMDRFAQNSAGGADIPMTRLFGQSPGGMNATGDSDLRNYYDRISSNQQLDVRPALEIFDECLIRSSLGSRPPEIHYLWNPLWQISSKERAELGRSGAATLKTLKDTGLIPDEVLARGAVTLMTQDGIIPGLEAEYTKYFEEGNSWDLPTEPPSATPPAGEDTDPEGAGRDLITDEQPRIPKGSPGGGQWTKGGGSGGAATIAAGKVATAKYGPDKVLALTTKDPKDLSHYEKKVLAKFKKELSSEVKAEVAAEKKPAPAPAAPVEGIGAGMPHFGASTEKQSADSIADAYGYKMGSKENNAKLTVEDLQDMGESELYIHAEHAYNTGDSVLLQKIYEVEPEAVMNSVPVGHVKQIVAQMNAAEKAEAMFSQPAPAAAPKAVPAAAAPLSSTDKALASVATAQYPADKIKGLLSKNPADLTQYEKKKLSAYKKALNAEAAKTAMASVAAPPPKPMVSASEQQAAYAQIAKQYGLKTDTVEKLATGEWQPQGHQQKAAAAAKEIAAGKLPSKYSKYSGYVDVEAVLSGEPPPTSPVAVPQTTYANYKPLEPAEKSAVVTYTGGMYQKINGDLRSGGSNSYAPGIDAAIAKSQTTKEMVVVRGVSAGAFNHLIKSSGGAELKPGAIITDKGYMSTTRKAGVAAGFAGTNGYGLKITVPKGASLMPVKSISQHAGEDEFLLPRNSRLRVIRVDLDNHLIHVEVA